MNSGNVHNHLYFPDNLVPIVLQLCELQAAIRYRKQVFCINSPMPLNHCVIAAEVEAN